MNKVTESAGNGQGRQACRHVANATSGSCDTTLSIGGRKLIVMEREETAYVLRRAGKTYREIGAALAVSPARAGQLVFQAERRKYLEERSTPRSAVRDTAAIGEIPIDNLLRLVSTRCRNAIRMSSNAADAGLLRVGRMETVGDILSIPDRELLNIRNFGRKSLQELKDVLRVLLERCAMSA